MNGSMPLLPQYASMAWCSVKAQFEYTSLLVIKRGLDFVCWSEAEAV